jgi:AhpD family alkylhydroperoxidase
MRQFVEQGEFVMAGRIVKFLVFASIGAGVTLGAAHAFAADAPSPNPADDAYAEMEKTFGGVPTFMKAFPKDAVAGAWAEMRDLEFNDKTALNAKTKELIGLAVAAQIPCSYCVYAHTQAAKRAGATDEEIREAVAMAAVTRHWSTFLNGMQVDLPTFKKEMAGEK